MMKYPRAIALALDGVDKAESDGNSDIPIRSTLCLNLSAPCVCAAEGIWIGFFDVTCNRPVRFYE